MSLSFLLFAAAALALLIYLAWRAKRGHARFDNSGGGDSGSWGSDASPCDNGSGSCDGGGGDGGGGGD